MPFVQLIFLVFKHLAWVSRGETKEKVMQFLPQAGLGVCEGVVGVLNCTINSRALECSHITKIQFDYEDCCGNGAS
ncbi:MAG: hypothetical protein NZ775_02055 [Gammaproteobacteria bacterium]|nr:hypothetical protein [Gammaproteobacteria bacterium]